MYTRFDNIVIAICVGFGTGEKYCQNLVHYIFHVEIPPLGNTIEVGETDGGCPYNVNQIGVSFSGFLVGWYILQAP